MKTKHKHNWQFKEEFQIPIEVVDMRKVKSMKLKMMYCIIYPLVIYEYYNRFVCECGKEKEVKIK